MYELNKEKFGEFLAVRRKKEGLTQKELAQKLFVSDKAVSKWERGAGMPDVSLLIPLADILGVTVTELLEGQELKAEVCMDTDQVENLVKKAITLSEEDPETVRIRKRYHIRIFAAAVLTALLEMLLLMGTIYTFEQGIDSGLFLCEGLSIAFGGYFWVMIKEKLPVYYDENRISAYSDGIFRMNMPGIHFNNSNWPFIVRTGRIWSAVSMISLPVLTLAGTGFFLSFWSTAGRFILLLMFLGGLFIPVYVAGKKYE